MNDGFSTPPAHSYRGDAWSGREVEQLALHEPNEYRKLLEGYFLLLGGGRVWWLCVAEAEDARWRDCVRAAIIATATRSKTTPTWLADFLDTASAYAARERVLRVARARFYTLERAA